MSSRHIWYLIYRLKENLQITVCLRPLIGGILRKCSSKLPWLVAQLAGNDRFSSYSSPVLDGLLLAISDDFSKQLQFQDRACSFQT
jgi:hypothetical protein